MIYEQIEDAIIARLSPALTAAGIDLVKLPETEAEMERPFENGRVTVCFKRATYGDPGDNRMRSTGNMVQNETVHIELVVQSRWLRLPNKGVYDVWDKCRRGLLGFRPADGDGMYLKEFEFYDKPTGIWSFASTFCTDRLVVEDYDESEFYGPNITQITTNDLLNNETEVTP